MEPNTLDKRDDALSFLVGHDTGVLATLSDEGTPRARLVYYTCDDSFNVYFITLANTRKAGDLRRDPHAAFVVSETDTPRTIQIEGKVTDLTDTVELDPMLTNFVHKLMSHERYGIPLTRFDASELKFFRLAPEWVRWGDFTSGRGNDEVFTEINPQES